MQNAIEKYIPGGGQVESVIENPRDYMLRKDRIPHIWCAGCGLGTATGCFIGALEEANIDKNKVCVISGIGCTGRVAGYLNVDSFHTTHGRAIPFATGLHLANPELKIVVFSGDGDLFAIGGNHFIHAARRNIDMTVICVNNFTYGMTGGQGSSTTHIGAKTTTTPYGNYENPFSLPHLAVASGAVYVARWTVVHVWRLKKAMQEALEKRGFSFIEVISPCPTNYGRRNRLGDGLDEMKYYRENSIIKHGAPLEETGLALGGKIVVGKFLEQERPTFVDMMSETLDRVTTN